MGTWYERAPCARGCGRTCRRRVTTDRGGARVLRDTSAICYGCLMADNLAATEALWERALAYVPPPDDGSDPFAGLA